MMTRFGLFCLILAVCCVHDAVGACLTMPKLLNADVPQTKVVIKKTLDGVNVTKLCPGMDYDVQINFPEARQFLLMATSGVWNSLTGSCTNHTSSSTAATSVSLHLSLGCDISGFFALSLASKAPGATTYLSKNFSLPVNPLTACPKSRCLSTSGASSAFQLPGLPITDMLGKLGVLVNMTSNKLDFNISTLPKTLAPDAFLKIIAGLVQFKQASKSIMADPTLMLSVLKKLCSVVPKSGSNSTDLLFVGEVSKLLNLWPNFWAIPEIGPAAAGLDVSGFSDFLTNMLPDSVLGSVKSANPAEAMLGVVSSIGAVVAAGTGSSGDMVPLPNIVGLLGAYTNFMSFIHVNDNI